MHFAVPVRDQNTLVLCVSVGVALIDSFLNFISHKQCLINIVSNPISKQDLVAQFLEHQDRELLKFSHPIVLPIIHINCYPIIHAICDSDTDSDTYPNPHAISNPDTNANPHTIVHPNIDQVLNAITIANSYSISHSFALTNPDTNGHKHPNQFREHLGVQIFHPHLHANAIAISNLVIDPNELSNFVEQRDQHRHVEQHHRPVRLPLRLPHLPWEHCGSKWL